MNELEEIGFKESLKATDKFLEALAAKQLDNPDVDVSVMLVNSFEYILRTTYSRFDTDLSESIAVAGILATLQHKLLHG